MRTIILLAVSVLIGGCATSGAENDTAERPQDRGTSLELWSHHKLLDVPVAACAEKAFDALTSLGFSDVVRNGNFSYGNIEGSRAAVKCVEMRQGSFVYFAVASADRDSAENFRNRISSKL